MGITEWNTLRCARREGIRVLDNGNQLPVIAARDLDGTEVTLKELTDGSWSAVLFYRGHW